MKKSTARSDVYIRASDFAARLDGVRLPPEVWAVFAQCDASRSPAEIARRARLDETAVISALRRLARRGLVQKNHIDWQAYLSTQSAAAEVDVAPPPAPATPAPLQVAAAPAPVPAPAPQPAPVAVQPIPPVAPVLAVVAPRAPDAPLEFTVANPVAAVARRVAMREVLTLCLEKSAAPRTGTELAA